MRAIHFYDNDLWWGSLYTDHSFCLRGERHVHLSYETDEYGAYYNALRRLDIEPCDGSCRRPGRRRNTWRKVVLRRSLARRIREAVSETRDYEFL